MENDLNTLADRINASRQTSSPGSHHSLLLGYLEELVRILKGGPVQNSEVSSLKAMVANQVLTINWQAGILQQVKDVSRMSTDKTMTQLPDHIKHLVSLVDPTKL